MRYKAPMYRFLQPLGNMSGGQQQRVAIAHYALIL